MEELDQYYLNQDEPNRSCLLALREIILAQDERISETRKWGMPCFCLGKKMFCFLWIDKKTQEPYLLMVEGQRMTHPQLEEGNRSRMKIFRLQAEQDLPLKTINDILEEGIALYHSTAKQ
ncbi:MAG: DUF1801 domain-containing protein [Bacteroidota bacterium]